MVFIVEIIKRFLKKSFEIAEQNYLFCDFEEDLCAWKQREMGMKWRRQVDSNTGQYILTIFVTYLPLYPVFINFHITIFVSIPTPYG